MPARKKEPQAQSEYYTIEEVSIILHLGKTKVRDLIRREQLPTVTFGRAIRVPIHKFVIWREERERRTSYAEKSE
ncbi:MAG: helix-turn-helix domain-containing protein [Chloroflexota bacterium]|nr:helix-turn-helix domain-containing protein [Chloroflexota bacterium]